MEEALNQHLMKQEKNPIDGKIIIRYYGMQTAKGLWEELG
jgi:hypothetical protein